MLRAQNTSNTVCWLGSARIHLESLQRSPRPRELGARRQPPPLKFQAKAATAAIQKMERQVT